MSGQTTQSHEKLRGFVERIERIDAQIKELKEDKAVVMAEAKADGFIPAGIAFVLKKRKMKPSARSEAETLEDLYLEAMGMAQAPPLFRAVGMMGVDIAARESVIAAVRQLVPSNGSITVEAAGGPPVRFTRDGAGNVSVSELIHRTESGPPGGAPPGDGAGRRGPARPEAPEAPEVDGDGAEALGREAFRADQPIIANPFPFGDARRPRWDLGWRLESGGDGMGPGA